eukprot:532478-Prymnesium_polylepis.1
MPLECGGCAPPRCVAQTPSSRSNGRVTRSRCPTRSSWTATAASPSSIRPPSRPRSPRPRCVCVWLWMVATWALVTWALVTW